MTTPIDSSVLTTFGITPADLDNQSVEPTPGTGLMNPEEYAQVLKKLRHLNMQENATEKTLTEIRIEKATLVRESVDRADHGQKKGIYEAAGMSPSAVSNVMSVKCMLLGLNVSTSKLLPSLGALQEVAGADVPKHIRKQVLDNPAITVKAARALVAEHKAAQVAKKHKARFGSSFVAPPARSPDPYTMIARFREMDFSGKCLVAQVINSDLGGGAYAVLGLLPSASDAVVKYAANDLRKKYHPDTGGATADSAMFQKVQEAVEAIQELRQKERAAAEAPQVRRNREILESLGGL